MVFDHPRYGFKGALHFLPLVTREDENATEESRNGLILGIGWIPLTFEHPTNRFRFENSFEYQDFVGIVTTNDEINGRNKKANLFDE